MNFTKEQIIDYADKLLIGLNEEEANTILKEFDVIDKNINMINEIDGLNALDITTSPFNLYTATLREDEATSSVDIDDILSNTKDKMDREIKVPKVVG